MQHIDLDGGIYIPMLDECFEESVHVKTGHVTTHGRSFKMFYHADNSLFPERSDSVVFRMGIDGRTLLSADPSDSEERLAFRVAAHMCVPRRTFLRNVYSLRPRNLVNMTICSRCDPHNDKLLQLHKVVLFALMYVEH